MSNFIHEQVRTVLCDLSIKRVVVAVSGGSDSICLLHVLKSLRKDLDLDITAAHLDHMIRGEEAVRDSTFVQSFCKKISIPCIAERIDVPKYQKDHNISSLEEAARIVRYAFLKQVAKEHDAVVLTGHNLDDNVETVLMHIIRGCGIDGLTGLELQKELEMASGLVIVVRPLLSVTKDQIVQYCHDHALPFCTDSTNADESYTRNSIRRELLPILTRYNPDIRGAINRLSDNVKEASSYLDEKLNDLDHLMSKTPGGVSVSRKAFSSLRPFEKKYLLKRMFILLNGNLQDIEKKHIDEMLRLSDGHSGKTLSLPHGLLWKVEYRTLKLSVRSDSKDLNCYDHVALKKKGQTAFAFGTITARIVPSNKLRMIKDNRHAYLDAAAVAELIMRPRKAGDEFIPFGSNAPVKVARFLMNEHVSTDERSRVWVLCNKKDVVWVIGHRIDDRYKVTAGTKDILSLVVRY